MNDYFRFLNLYPQQEKQQEKKSLEFQMEILRNQERHTIIDKQKHFKRPIFISMELNYNRNARIDQKTSLKL